jgi:hypothetical protein
LALPVAGSKHLVRHLAHIRLLLGEGRTEDRHRLAASRNKNFLTLRHCVEQLG